MDVVRSNYCFNSTIVRLKEGDIRSRMYQTRKFQFYDSTIKRVKECLLRIDQYGFNSTIVRLKVQARIVYVVQRYRVSILR